VHKRGKGIARVGHLVELTIVSRHERAHHPG
jgi:hypothetical protein